MELVDEMMEDPRCLSAVLGYDESGSVLFSLWDPQVVEEVVAGLREVAPKGAVVRRLQLRVDG